MSCLIIKLGVFSLTGVSLALLRWAGLPTRSPKFQRRGVHRSAAPCRGECGSRVESESVQATGLTCSCVRPCRGALSGISLPRERPRLTGPGGRQRRAQAPGPARVVVGGGSSTGSSPTCFWRSAKDRITRRRLRGDSNFQFSIARPRCEKLSLAFKLSGCEHDALVVSGQTVCYESVRRLCRSDGGALGELGACYPPTGGVHLPALFKPREFDDNGPGAAAILVPESVCDVGIRGEQIDAHRPRKSDDRLAHRLFGFLR